MRRFLIEDRGAGLVRGRGLFFLALLEEFQLSAEGEDFLLLEGNGLVQGLDSVFLKSHLALQFDHFIF